LPDEKSKQIISYAFSKELLYKMISKKYKLPPIKCLPQNIMTKIFGKEIWAVPLEEFIKCTSKFVFT
jgi:hypothetical protein